MRGADCNTRQFVVESVEQRFGYLGRLGGSVNVDREAFDRKYTRRLNPQQTEAVHAVDGAVLLLAVGCGEKGAGKILSTEGVPQEVLQSAQYKAALAEETATVIAYNYVPLTDSAPVRAAVKKMQAGEDAELRYYNF